MEGETDVEARPKAVMVIAEGRCKVVGEAKSNEFGCAQEPLPEGMRVLLCLIDGAERRQDLLRRWSGEAVPVLASAKSYRYLGESKPLTSATASARRSRYTDFGSTGAPGTCS